MKLVTIMVNGNNSIKNNVFPFIKYHKKIKQTTNRIKWEKKSPGEIGVVWSIFDRSKKKSRVRKKIQQTHTHNNKIIEQKTKQGESK